MNQVELLEGRTFEFDRLLDAVYNAPWKVRNMVEASPDLLRATNWSGENVLHWLAVEGEAEKAAILIELGSPIPPFALVHAADQGHLEMTILFLESGTEVEWSHIQRNFEKNSFGLSKRTLRILNSYFKQYGYGIA